MATKIQQDFLDCLKDFLGMYRAAVIDVTKEAEYTLNIRVVFDKGEAVRNNANE